MIGRNLLTTNNIAQTRVSADNNPVYKVAGVTIDWGTVAAVNADTTLADNSVIRNGQKFLRYGQVLTKITTGAQDTLTITATGGTYTLSVTAGGSTQPTGNLNYNDNAATIQAALRLLSNVGGTNATVTGTGPFTITLDPSLGGATVAVNTGSLTGGSATIATTTAIGTNYGAFGPYDPAAVDGRQTLTRGACYVLDETIPQYDAGTGALSTENTHTGRCIEGGRIFINRVLQAGTGTHTLAAGPTLAEFLAAFPAFFLVQN